MTRARLIASFVVPVAALSFAIALSLHLLGRDWTSPLGRAAAVLYLFAVLPVTLVVQGPVLKQPVLEPLGLVLRPNGWWLVAWLSPVFVLFLALALAKVLYGADVVLTAEAAARYAAPGEGEPPAPITLVLMALPIGVTLDLVLALVAEIGFRGLLFREMPGSFWPRSLSIGALHALWLAPIGPFLVGEAGWRGHLLGAAFGLVASPVLVALRARSGSVIASSAFLGTVFALGRVGHDLGRNVEAWQAPFFGASGLLALAIFVVLLYLHDRFFTEVRLISAQTKNGPSTS